MADPETDKEDDDLEDLGQEIADDSAEEAGEDVPPPAPEESTEAEGEAQAETEAAEEKSEEVEDPARKKPKAKKEKGGSKQIVLLVGVISLVVILSVGIGAGVAGGIALMLMGNKQAAPVQTEQSSNVSGSQGDKREADGQADSGLKVSDEEVDLGSKAFLPPNEASGKAYYYALKPTFLINLAPYIPPPLPEGQEPKKGEEPPKPDMTLHYMQVSVTLMTRDQAMLEVIAQHQSLIKNDLVVLFSSKNIRVIKTPEGKEQMRLEALQVVRKALNQDRDFKNGVENVFFTTFVTQ